MDDNESTMGESDDTYELDELLGAYALDAVDAGERDRVEDYLRINPKAAAEVQEHREVATMLAFTGMDAPADLWSKITAEIDADAPAPGPELAKVFAFDPPVPAADASDAATPMVDATVMSDERRRTRRGVGTWVLGAAAAIALAIAGAVVVIGAQDTTSNDPIADAFERAVDDRDSVQAELVTEGSQASAFGVIDQDGHGYLDAAALPRLAPEQTYQLWGVLEENGDVVSLGILGRNPELETFTIEGDVSALAVTIEMAPGVVSDGNSDGAFVGAFG
ncbi:MAG: anti-sigma factor [Ilumatobacter sp.]|uniref:anti-sigma factor domain-containing protein n=1 Tax=Ilumatobacter sp. TaxID=1967498 RepID=UPI003C755096